MVDTFRHNGIRNAHIAYAEISRKRRYVLSRATGFGNVHYAGRFEGLEQLRPALFQRSGVANGYSYQTRRDACLGLAIVAHFA